MLRFLALLATLGLLLAPGPSSAHQAFCAPGQCGGDLPTGCADTQIAKWAAATSTWDCAADAGAGTGDDITVTAAFGDPVDPLFDDTATIAVTATDLAIDEIIWDVVADSLTATHIDETGAYDWTGAHTFSVAGTDGIYLVGGDPADTGLVRLSNAAAGMCWEAAPTSTDVCVLVDANEVFTITGGTFDATVLSGDVPVASVGADHLDAMGEIAAGIKRGPDATDTHLLTTDVAAPGSLDCLEMDTDGSVVLAGAPCGSGGATTDAGAVTHVTSVTDDFAIGGTTSAAAYFFDEATGAMSINVAGASVDIQQSATLGQDLILKEGADETGGTDEYHLKVDDTGGLTSGGANTGGGYSGLICTLHLSGRIPDECVGDGSDGGASGANPTASVGLSAVNGAAGTFLRSDGAPALSQAIAPDWTGDHVFNAEVDIGTVETFGNPDTTPDVTGGIYWTTNTVANTITDFDPASPTNGQILYVIASDGGTILDCTASFLECGTADITMASRDVAHFIFTGTNWTLISYVDQADNLGSDGTGGTPSFDAITSGTNSTAAMVVASGAILEVSAGGEIESNEVVIHVNNDSGADIPICSAVYISGFDIPSDLPEISVADADNAGAFPAIGVAHETITNGSNGKVVMSGELDDIDTSTAEGWTVGDRLYVNDTGTSVAGDCENTLTNVRPANTDDSVQAIATVLRVHNTAGELSIIGAGRGNQLPNLTDANFWVGNGTNLATAVSMGGVMTMSNTGAVTITGNDALDPDFVVGDDTDNDLLDVSVGGTGVATLAVGGILTGNTAGSVVVLAPGATTTILVGGGAGTIPVWTTVTGTGAPVRATSPTLVTPVLGVAAATSITVTSQTECIVLNAGGATQKAAGTSALTTYDGTNFSYPAWDLDSATDEQIDWNYGLPPNVIGTTATVEVRWSAAACTAATADDVCFVWNGGGLQDDDALHTAAFSGTETFIQDKCSAANDEQWAAATSWTHGYDVASPKDNGAVFQIIREQVADATCTGDNDAITGDVKLLAVRICYEVENVFSGEGG